MRAAHRDGVSGTPIVRERATEQSQARPALLEPNPKRCIDDRYVLLGEREVAVEALLAAILRRVRVAAEQAAGSGGVTWFWRTRSCVCGSAR